MPLFTKRQYQAKTAQEKEEEKIFGANYQLYRKDLEELGLIYQKLQKDNTFLKGNQKKHKLYKGLKEEEIFAVVFGFNMLSYFLQTHKDLPTLDFQLLIFSKFFPFSLAKAKSILKRSSKIFDDYFEKTVSKGI